MLPRLSGQLLERRGPGSVGGEPDQAAVGGAVAVAADQLHPLLELVLAEGAQIEGSHPRPSHRSRC